MILTPDICPDNVKQLSLREKQQLCTEIRALIIETITRNGGHLASSLGAVELCVALHSVFTVPDDKIIFDVGHQAYAHKILTGRMEQFAGIRTENGISGFPRPSESECDAFVAGHASIAISAALGIAQAMELKGDFHHVVSVVGDGAFTGGEAYEGLNNVCKLKRSFIIVLNDNEMSISKNSGAIAAYLAQMRSTNKYFDTKKKVKDILSKSAIGRDFSKSVSGMKDMVKFAIFQSNIFENLGYKYLGPIDGHNLNDLIEALTVASRYDRPCIVHIKTKKGKGYAPAEQNSGAYHGLSKHKSGECELTWSEIFGRHLASLAADDSRICGISAAMKYATGMQHLKELSKSRFFDVGIAEEHAVTFACGLASQGMLPVYAVYSTFLQRCYDQLIHDVSIEKYHVVLAVDRAGIVGEDGETHQGLFDVAMLSSMPGATLYSPSNDKELCRCLNTALYETEGLAAVRYPRGKAVISDQPDADYDYRYLKRDGEKHTGSLIITYGRTVNEAKKTDCDMLQLVKIWPIPETVLDIMEGYNNIVFFEEGIKQGGIGEKTGAALMERGFSGKYHVNAIDGQFVKWGDAEKMLEKFNLTAGGMMRVVKSYE